MRKSILSMASEMGMVRAGIRAALWSAALATALAGTSASAQTLYARTNLVSDVPGVATFLDTNLMGAWGAVHSATSPWWVNSTMGGVSLVYNGAGEPFPTNHPLKVTIPPTHAIATGIVFNNHGGFEVASNKSSIFIFATLNGTLSGWNPGQTNPLAAVPLVSPPGAGYAGIALAPMDGSNTLYAANFDQDRVDVFDANLQPLTLSSNAFSDPEVPQGLSVFNVQAIRTNLLFVTYAPTNVFGTGTAPGAGFVSVFDTSGTLLGHLQHGFWMNAPWGVTEAPQTGNGQGDNNNNQGNNNNSSENLLLVGMFGDGRFATFDQRGDFLGFLRGLNRQPVTIGMGLWALGFGNGANAGPTNVLYFATDMVTTNGFHGVFGALLPTIPQRPLENDQGENNNDQGNNQNQGNDQNQ